MREISMLLVCWLIACFNASGQVYIRGKLTATKTGMPLHGIRVDLKDADSSRILAYTFSDMNGDYGLFTKEKGALTLTFKAFSYYPLSKSVVLDTTNIEVNAQLTEGEPTIMKGVVVYGKRNAFFKKDTIELDAKNYLQGNEKTVEDLLKKIPGLQVSKDGSIKIGQKEVEKVMVEGDDFFEKGYRLLTQNMSVKPVQKVQVLQRYSNNKHLKGVENSDKIALNLTLKEDAKNEWMGYLSAAGSIAPAEFYNVQLSMMNFSKKSKYFLLGAANNNGVDAVSSINHLIQENTPDEPGQIGSDVSTPSIIDNTPSLPNFDYRLTNFNKDKLLSLNTIFNPTPALKIKWIGFANPTRKFFTKKEIQNYNIEDIQITNTQDYSYAKKIDNYFTKWNLQCDVNSKSTLTYTGKLGSLHQEDKAHLTFNELPSLELTGKTGFLTNHHISFTQKISERKALVSSLRWMKEQSPLDYYIDQYYYQDLFQQSEINGVQQKIKNNLQYWGFITHYLSKAKNRNVFESSISYEKEQRELITELLLNTNNGEKLLPEGFANQVRFATNNITALTKYTFTGYKIELVPQLRTSILHTSLSSHQNNSSRNNWLLSPQLAAKWILHKKGELKANMMYQQASTRMMDMVPDYYTTGVRNFVKGLDDINVLNNLGASASYTYGSWADKFYTQLTLGKSRYFDYISSHSIMAPNYNLSQAMIFKNRETSFYNLQLNYYLKALNGNLKLNAGTNFSNYESSVEGVGVRNIRSRATELSLEFRSAWKYWLNMHGGKSFQFASFDAETTTRLLNRNAFLHLFFSIHKNTRANLKNDVYYIGDILSKGQAAYYFSDLSISHQLLKTKISFDITCKNIFNTNQFTNAALTDTYSSIITYRLLPRYIMIGLNYNF